MSALGGRAYLIECCEELLKDMYEDVMWQQRRDIRTILPIQIDGEQVCGICKNERCDINSASGSTVGVCSTCVRLYRHYNDLDDEDALADASIESVIDSKVRKYVDANLVSIEPVGGDPDCEEWTLYGAEGSILARCTCG